MVRDHIGGAIPGYGGHLPGHRVEVSTIGNTFRDDVQACRTLRSRASVDPQQHLSQTRERATQRLNATSSSRAPLYDTRGHHYPAAGDTQHSRVPAQGEEKAHFHSSLGLTSLAHENLGGAGSLKGYGAAARGIPGYRGYVPGKHAENVHAEGWSKSHERSLGAHFEARATAPKKRSIVTEGGTIVHSVPSDALKEKPIHNPSFNDRVRGWSQCEFTGTHIDPAGRAGPKDRQESFGGTQPNVYNCAHGYAGWVPGRVGESVVGERQAKTNAVSTHLHNRNRMRITQR